MANEKQFLDIPGLTYLWTQLKAKFAGKTHNHAAGDINSGTLSSDRLPTVPVEKGGTGAASAEAARAALGVPSTDEMNTAITDAKKAGTDAQSTISTHASNKSNPHGVTAAQVGARPSTWTPTAADVGAVPTTRKVNGKALSADISLSASDVGAAATGHGHDAATTSAAGFMSAADKAKLDGIAEGATADAAPVVVTIPAGRMIGDVDGDGKITQNDIDITEIHARDGNYITDEIALLCADANQDGSVNVYDLNVINYIISGRTKVGAFGDLIGNWTANPNYATEEYQFYVDVPAEVTPEHSVTAFIFGTSENGNYTAECFEGYVRVYAKLLPIAETSALILVSKGDSESSVSSAPHYHDVSEVVGAVPTSRTVNGKDLSSNITLSADDVGAATTGHTHDGYAPMYSYGTADLTAGSSALPTGQLYFVYE